MLIVIDALVKLIESVLYPRRSRRDPSRDEDERCAQMRVQP